LEGGKITQTVTQIQETSVFLNRQNWHYLNLKAFNKGKIER
jgi:hypothetical protein